VFDEDLTFDVDDRDGVAVDFTRTCSRP